MSIYAVIFDDDIPKRGKSLDGVIVGLHTTVKEATKDAEGYVGLLDEKVNIYELVLYSKHEPNKR